MVCLGHHAVASTSPLFPSSTFPCQSPHLYRSEMGIKYRTKPSLSINLGIKVDNKWLSKNTNTLILYITMILEYIWTLWVLSWNVAIIYLFFEIPEPWICFIFFKYPDPMIFDSKKIQNFRSYGSLIPEFFRMPNINGYYKTQIPNYSLSIMLM